MWCFINQFLDTLQHRIRCECDLCLGVIGDRLDALKGAIATWRIDRYCHNPRIETPEEGGNELQARRIKKQGSFPTKVVGLKPRANGPRSPIELTIGHFYDFVFTVNQVGEGNVIALMLRPMANQFDEGRGTEKSPWQTIQWHDDSSSAN